MIRLHLQSPWTLCQLRCRCIFSYLRLVQCLKLLFGLCFSLCLSLLHVFLPQKMMLSLRSSHCDRRLDWWQRNKGVKWLGDNQSVEQAQKSSELLRFSLVQRVLQLRCSFSCSSACCLAAASWSFLAFGHFGQLQVEILKLTDRRENIDCGPIPALSSSAWCCSACMELKHNSRQMSLILICL